MALPRSALSASRAIQLVEVLAADAGRAFSLTELVRETKSNFASCHAVLTVLTANGYLLRDEGRKSYRLGPALYAAGQATAAGDPLLRATLAGGEALAAATGLAVNISVRVGDDLIGVARFGEAQRRFVGLPAGQRVPLAPPIGATLLAWSDDAEIDRWIGRGDIALASEAATALREILADIRRRGYLATLDTDSYAEISAMVARRNDPDPAQRPRGIAARDLFGGLGQPDPADREGRFDIAYIGAPIFDGHGRPTYSVILSGLAARIDWRTIEDLATEVTRTCADVVRAVR